MSNASGAAASACGGAAAASAVASAAAAVAVATSHTATVQSEAADTSCAPSRSCEKASDQSGAACGAGDAVDGVRLGSRLRIWVEKATGIPTGLDNINEADPYVVCILSDEKYFSTIFKRNDCNPVWNHGPEEKTGATTMRDD